MRAAVIVLCSVLACTSRPAEREPSEETTCGALELETSGCAWIGGGTACELGETRELRMWIAAPEKAAITFDDGTRTITATHAAGGYRYAWAVPAGVERLKIRRGCKQLDLNLPAAPQIHPVISEADAMRRRGELEAALARISAELPQIPERDRGRALGMLARIERSAGDLDKAAQHFREAISAHRARGDVSLEARDRIVLAYTLITHFRRFHEAHEVLNDPLFARAPDADVQITAAQYRALRSIETGDLRTALGWLEESERRALRIDLIDLWRDAKQFTGSTLLGLGRADDAVELFDEILRLTPETEDPCLRGMLFTNVGWARIIQREQAREEAAGVKPEEPLRHALAIWKGACPEPVQVQNVLINLALAAVQENRWKDAQRHLDEINADRTPLNPELMLWRLEIEGRLALAANRGREALSVYRRLHDLAASTASSSGIWRAAIGRGHALELVGNLKAAADAYRDAEAILDRASVLVPLGEGREHFLGGHAESAKSAINVLLRLDRHAEAVELARRARVRPLAALQRAHVLEGLSQERRVAWEQAIAAHRNERDLLDRQAAQDWRLPQNRLNEARSTKQRREQELERTLEHALALLSAGARTEGVLRAPRAGELFLVYHPVQRGYAGFAVTASAAVSRLLGEIDPAAAPEVLGSKLLEPFREMISSAETIFLMPAGELRDIDVHALPFDGAPLIARAPAVYALDFAESASTSAARPRELGNEALIVADPDGNLAAAELEAENTARVLRTRGWRVETLLRAQANGSAVRAGLARARRFYYAGHARFGGLDGWESALPLAHRGKLTVADILALHEVPETVVLSGCETARSGRRALGDSLGIAHAFLTAGAREIVATSRPIGDRAAAAFSAELQDAEMRSDPRVRGAFARVVRDAQLAFQKREPELDWRAFRALVR